MYKHMGNNNQRGFIAIFTVIIIMALLALITVGFSAITRDAQRRTLDDALNQQAFYAAETGVTRVAERIRTGVVSADDSDEDCADTTDTYGYDVDSQLGVKISCLLIDTTPDSLVYDRVPVIGTAQSVATYVRPYPLDTTTNIESIRVEFDTDNPLDLTDAGDERPNRTFTSNSPTLPAAGTYGTSNIGILRMDLVPIRSAYQPDDLRRASLASSAYTFFLHPAQNTTSGAGTLFTTNPNHANQGASFLVACTNSTTSQRCVATINLSGFSTNAFFLRMHSYYAPTSSRITIYGAPNASGGQLQIWGSQALVDSTGRVGDVSRRIQVRLPLNPIPGYHEAFSVLSGESICKRLVVIPAEDGGSTYHPDNVSSVSVGGLIDTNLCSPAQP